MANVGPMFGQVNHFVKYNILSVKYTLGRDQMDSNQSQSKLENIEVLILSSENEIVKTSLR